MEKFSQIIRKNRIPITISVLPYLFDHQFMGKAVLPAVEAMRILVDSTQMHIDKKENVSMVDATFDKFLFLRGNEDSIEAFNDMEVLEKDLIQSKLMTRFQSGKTSIIRFIEHVTLNLSFCPKPAEEKAFDPESLIGENPFEIAPDVIYRELVPFGPAYQNIREPMFMSLNGVIASVYGGDPIDGDNSWLGSPFTLDAAFHAACAWGQRYNHVVAFPVGFSERQILSPTRYGNTYVAFIKPVQSDNLLVFDIRICDREGNIHENISGVRMRDVSGGRLKPPEWILDKEQVPV